MRRFRILACTLACISFTLTACGGDGGGGNPPPPPQTANGSFKDANVSQGTRIGGLVGAVFRFTGAFAGDDAGLFTFDVDAANNASGVAYSVIEDEQFNITGTLAGTTVFGTVTGGSTFTGTLDTATGALTGIWINASGGDGNFGGDGCRLN